MRCWKVPSQGEATSRTSLFTYQQIGGREDLRHTPYSLAVAATLMLVSRDFDRANEPATGKAPSRLPLVVTVYVYCF